MRRVFFFFVNDFIARIKYRRRLLLSILPYLFAGIALGAIIASNIKETEYAIGFAVIFTNEFKPFATFFTFVAILAISLFFVYFNSKGVFFGVVFRGVNVYLGYIIGRVAALSVINNVFFGILSIIFFLLPSVLVVVFCEFYAFSDTCDRLLCGSDPRNNLLVFKPCVKSFIIGVCFLLLIEMLAVIINSAVNVIS